jgi:hypothetical protein
MGLACTDNVCRAGPTCQQLRSDGECFAHQACVEMPGVGGACVVDVCEDGWLFDKATGGCVACPSCVTGKSCVASTAGIGDECAAAYRTCAESSGVAACGACVDGANLVDGKCVPTIRCGDSVCTDGQYCDRIAKTCQPLPCASGSAKSAGPNGQCAPCSTSCTGTGLTGRYWPFRTITDKCVCETYEGFYLEASALKAGQCDADDDGWVRLEADDSSIREDNALLQNARCDIRRVDRVVLRDEYGIELPLDSCRAEGFVQAGGACAERFPLRLLESGRNDQPGSVSTAQTPVYGHEGRGRNLSGPELNGLTKACVSDLGDFDADGVEDLNQTQPLKIVEAMSDSERLRAFSYFVELYRSQYVAPSARPYGDLVISERSRCTDFPLHYSADDAIGVVGANNGDPSYWRSCSRFRDPAYDAMVDKPGYDFAQFSCASGTGSCEALLPGPASPTLNYASVNPASTLLRDVGLCGLQGQLPKDAQFRGFGHHSQFRCMKVTETPRGPNEATRASFDNGRYVFNSCDARHCNADDADCAQARVTDGGYTLDPYVDCTPQVPAPNAVGFAALRYQPYGPKSVSPDYATDRYQGGCVNEDTQWGSKLCPAPEFSVFRRTDSYGRYSCYGSGSLWLWAPDGSSMRSTLIWSVTPGAVTPTTPAWCN